MSTATKKKTAKKTSTPKIAEPKPVPDLNAAVNDLQDVFWRESAQERRADFKALPTDKQNQIRQRLLDEIHFCLPFLEEIEKTLSTMGAETSSTRTRLDSAYDDVNDVIVSLMALLPDWEADEED